MENQKILNENDALIHEAIQRKNKGRGYITISTTISPEYYVKAQKYNISWTEALKQGIALILSKIGDEELNNPYQMTNKVELLAKKLEEFAQENNKLKEQLETIKK
jgi:cell shape-determining protein MreC